MSGVRSLSLTGCLRERPLVQDKMNTDGKAAPALTLMAYRSPPSSPKQLVLEGEAGRRRRTQTGGENMSSVRCGRAGWRYGDLQGFGNWSEMNVCCFKEANEQQWLTWPTSLAQQHEVLGNSAQMFQGGHWLLSKRPSEKYVCVASSHGGWKQIQTRSSNPGFTGKNTKIRRRHLIRTTSFKAPPPAPLRSHFLPLDSVKTYILGL